MTEAIKQAEAVANINLPNCLTALRILLIPVFVVLFSDPTPGRSLASALVFLGAAVTDLLDGYLARRCAQVTRLGRLLDPIADKLLVLSGLILLVQYERVPAIVAIVIIAREVAVTGIRAVALAQGFTMEAETTGKYKMVAQVLAIVLLILENGLFPPWGYVHLLGTALLYVALALTVYSGIRYLVTFWQQSVSKGLGF
jgi:CDP-diacylglycerol--glycerol-3-phosphate 3-phosphatidyltransferase